MTSNRLANENSPYLLQHAENPVDWYPWGEEALEKARREDKPVFLSIGYAACHWCHVMAHESFENQQTAAILNENFVNIKVDREERPDLDSVYMNAVVAMTGHGGWPMSVFLTPDGKPFFGGTYFPPVRRYNMPSFQEVLSRIIQAWNDERPNVIQSGQEITRHIQNGQNLPGSNKAIQPGLLNGAALRLAQQYDWKFGGWGDAPKFPQPMAIEFLLRRAARDDKLAIDMASHALTAMARGGMYDVIGGGFARYSTDDQWLVPHFEKMLYDNAQLAQVYLHAYLITGNTFYRRICEETLDFIRREMMAGSDDTTSLGGIYSSLDADSEGSEGKYYIWSKSEIETALAGFRLNGSESLSLDWAKFFINAYGITENGNFEGRTVLQRAIDDKALAQQYNLSEAKVVEYLTILHQHLLSIRETRLRPATDDKVLVTWNALALIAFSEAARYLQREDYLQIAKKNADFLLSELYGQNRLLRSWRNGQAHHNAYLEDYAGLILGLLSLYQSDPDPWWFNSALQLAEEMIEHFRDEKGGFFDTRDDHHNLIIRPKDIQDNATPSGNAQAAMALLQLSAYTGNGHWRDLAEQSFSLIVEYVEKHPTAFSQWLCAIDFAIGPIFEIALLGDLNHPEMQEMQRVLWKQYRPHCIAAIADFPPESNTPSLLKDRPLLNHQPTAYVCQNFVCQKPVNTAAEMDAQLSLRDSGKDA